MFRILVIAAVAVLVGFAVGLGATWWELGPHADDASFTHDNVVQTSSAAGKGPGGRPSAVVENGPLFNFGVMNSGASKSHTFVIKNEGTAPLELRKGQTSCKCTLSELSQLVLQSGESASLTITWDVEGEGTTVRQTARILTNDPEYPVIELTIEGFVTQLVRVVPLRVSLGNLSDEEPQSAQFDVLGYRDEELHVDDWQFEDTPSADYFDLKFVPLSAEELASYAHVHRGLRAIITVKPGLPLGPVRQTIRLTTNVPDMKPLEVFIGGTVVSDISVVGEPSILNREHNLLTLGMVDPSEGRKVTLFVLVKGKHRGDLALEVGSVVPDMLRVSVGEREELGNGRVIKFPVVVEVPPGAKTVSYLGPESAHLGKIILETTHPDIPRLPLYVKFAVE